MKYVKSIFVCIGILTLLCAVLNPSTGQFSEYILIHYPKYQNEQEMESLGYNYRTYGRLRNCVVFSEFGYYNSDTKEQQQYYGFLGNFFRRY